MSAPIKLPPDLQQYFECRIFELGNIVVDSPSDQVAERFVNKLKSIFDDGGAFIKKGIKDVLDDQIARYGRAGIYVDELYYEIEAMTVNSIIEKMIKAKK